MTIEEMIKKIEDLFDQNNIEEAKVAIKEALKKFPNNTEILQKHGLLLDHIGKTDEALESFNKIVTIDSESDQAWKCMGIIYTRQENHEEAAEAFKKTEELVKKRISENNQDIEAWMNLADCYFWQQKTDEGLEVYKSVLEFEPENMEVLGELTHALNVLGKNEQAETYARKILELSITEPSGWAKLITACYLQGKYHEPVNLLLKTSQPIQLDVLMLSYTINQTVNKIFMNHGLFNELDRARKHFCTFISLLELDKTNKTTAWYHYVMARCYGVLKQTDKLLTHLKSTFELDDQFRTIAFNDPHFQDSRQLKEYQQLFPSKFYSELGKKEGKRLKLDPYSDNTDKVVIKDSVIYILFDYPLNFPVILEFSKQGGFSLSDILNRIDEGYTQIYNQEEEVAGDPGSYPNLLNRQPSFGPYGIWGHVKEDLDVQGISYDTKQKLIKLDMGS